MDKKGKTIDTFSLENFIGKAKIVNKDDDFPQKIGLVFKSGKLDIDIFSKLQAAQPLFIVIGNITTMSIDLGKKLLQNQILTFTDLINLDQLPTSKLFTFFGIPLKIKDGDGSPIRAFAIID